MHPNLLQALRQSGRHTPLFSFAGRRFYGRLAHAHDADTIVVCADLGHMGNVEGPYDIKRLIVRFTGIDAPEIRTKDENEKRLAINARTRMLNKIDAQVFPLDKDWGQEKDIDHALDTNFVPVFLETEEQDKYGRTLARVFSISDMKQSLNDWSIEEKLVDIYSGKTKERTWAHFT